MTRAIDPADFNVLSGCFRSIAQEMSEIMLRAAYSSIVREAKDCSTCLMDAEARFYLVDFDKARDVLDVPDDFKVEMAIAIGKTGSPDVLSEGLREREVPSQRMSLSDIAYAGRMQP